VRWVDWGGGEGRSVVLIGVIGWQTDGGGRVWIVLGTRCTDWFVEWEGDQFKFGPR
jgi:hypothetical protein